MNTRNRLIYRRQYILTPDDIKCPFESRSFQLTKDYQLLYHPDLPFTKTSDKDKQIVLLGDIYDYSNTDLLNQDILNGLLNGSLDDLLVRISRMAGRFILIYSDLGILTVLTDANAARKVFFARKQERIICASTQHLLAEIIEAESSKDPSLLSYYRSQEFKLNFFSNIGDTTFYPEIRQLLPNHKLDIRSSEISRFWPRDVLENLSDRDIIQECATMIRGFLKAAANRYPLMIPVSSGYDSRILLAASKDIKNNVFYYLNDSSVVRSSGDGWVPQKMLSEQDLEFNLLRITEKSDEEFREIYFKNNRFANPEYLDIIYNYYQNYQEKLNLPGGVVPVIKASYHSNSSEVTGLILAKLHGYDKFKFAIEFYDRWLADAKEVSEKTNTNIYDMIYWEDRTSNWAMGIQQDKDIAQEDFVVFNSAYLVSRMLTFEKRRRQSPIYGLHKEIIRELWPELLSYPFNPSARNWLKHTLVTLKLFYPIQKIKKSLYKL